MDEIKEKIKQLESKRNHLYDKFTRAAHSRSGSILMQMCEVDKQIAELKKQCRAKRRNENGKTDNTR